jgi:hypothetical protein
MLSEEKILENHWLCEEKTYAPSQKPKVKINYLKSIAISFVMICMIKLIGLIPFIVICFGVGIVYCTIWERKNGL